MAGQQRETRDDYNLVKLKEEFEEIKNCQQNSSPFGKRHIQSLLLFLSLSVSLTARAQLSVTIVAMTDTLQNYMQDNNYFINASINFQNGIEIIDGSPVILNENVSSELNVTKQEQYTKTATGNYFNISNEHNMLPFGNDDKKENYILFENKYRQNYSRGDADSENIYRAEISTSQNTFGWTVHRTYNWSKSIQEMITGSFFVGYSSMQVPMGILSQRFGGKLPLVVALLVNGVLSIITPWAAIIGWQLVCACRLLQGMTQAALYPGIQTMLGKWAPVTERGRLTSYIFTGSQFGTIVAFQLGGFLAGSPSLGWPFSFWVSGALCLACGALLLALGAAAPADHPTITAAEKMHIMGYHDENCYQAKKKAPWKAILRSLPVWAMVGTHAGSTYGYIFLLVQMPVYMSKVLHVNIKDNGLFSSLPYMAMYVTGIMSGQLSDFFINRGYVSVINARRIANSIGMVVSAVMMAGTAFVSSVPLAVTLLVLSMTAHSGVHVGFLINQIDLAPNFAGTLMSLANLVGSFASLGAPVLVSLIVTNAENQSQWQIVFLITAAIMIITNCFYVIFIKAEVQPWNDLNQSDNVLPEEFHQNTFGFISAHIKTEDSKLEESRL